jgi:hypothetical protein
VSVTGTGFICPPDSICYVDADATGAGDGSSWTDAYTDLQTALVASQCDNITEVWVAEGAYRPTDGTTRGTRFNLRNGIKIYGGFNGTETMLGQRDFESYVTILSGDIGVPGDSTDNSYHVVGAGNVDSTAVIDGFTITGGYADGGGSEGLGGGMTCSNGNPRIINVIFSNNATGTAGHGGGMYCYSTGNPTIMNTVFSHNYTGEGGHGAGIYNDGGNPVLMNVIFDSNSSRSSGGGMFNEGGNPAFIDVTFINNHATYFSGAAVSTIITVQPY